MLRGVTAFFCLELPGQTKRSAPVEAVEAHRGGALLRIGPPPAPRQRVEGLAPAAGRRRRAAPALELGFALHQLLARPTLFDWWRAQRGQPRAGPGHAHGRQLHGLHLLVLGGTWREAALGGSPQGAAPGASARTARDRSRAECLRPTR